MWNMILAQVQSKRFWVTLTSVITVIVGSIFPEYLTGALTIAGVLQAWVLGEATRPAQVKIAPKAPPESDQLKIMKDILDAVQSTKVTEETPSSGS